MTHLGDQVCVLIDGELTGDAHEQALAHLAECGQCWRAAADYRRLKALVATLDDCGDPSPDFLGRLLTIPQVESGLREPTEAPPVWHAPRRPRSRRLLGRTAPSRPLKTGVPASNRRPRNRTVAAAGFAASVVVGLGGAISGSVAVTATAGSASANGPSAPTTSPTNAVIAIPVSAVVPRPGGRVAVSVVYRRP
ncbi:MAG TPA: hypothetical protein VK662_08595 [Acidothermaceae bacterium]|nr:hypothetical protein [Acidothermaceae bacterium]